MTIIKKVFGRKSYDDGEKFGKFPGFESLRKKLSKKQESNLIFPMKRKIAFHWIEKKLGKLIKKIAPFRRTKSPSNISLKTMIVSVSNFSFCYTLELLTIFKV